MLLKVGGFHKLSLIERKKNKNGDLNLDEWFKPEITSNLTVRASSNINEGTIKIKNNNKKKKIFKNKIKRNHKDNNDTKDNKIITQTNEGNKQKRNIKSARNKKQNKLRLSEIRFLRYSVQDKREGNIIKQQSKINNKNIKTSRKKSPNQNGINFLSKPNNNCSNENNKDPKLIQPNIQTNKYRAISSFCKFIPLKIITQRKNKNNENLLHRFSYRSISNSVSESNLKTRQTISKLNKCSSIHTTFKRNLIQSESNQSVGQNNTFFYRNSASSLILQDLYIKRGLLNYPNNTCNSGFNNSNNTHHFEELSNSNFLTGLSTRRKQKIKLKTILYRQLQ